MDASYWNRVWTRKYERYNRHHLEIWEAVVPFLMGKVLDLGCGPCVLYEGKDIDLTGVDFSEDALEQAKLHYPKGRYICANARNTGIQEKFDVVVMFGLLDYFEDWNEVLTEARRLTQGRIYATLLHKFNNHDWSEYPRITGNWHLYYE